MSEPDPNAPPTPPTPGGNEPPARPEWLPEAHWNTEANAIGDGFGAHYGELADFHKTSTETKAALAARKPEDIKIEFTPPADLKIPDGMQVKIDENDPRIPLIRELAIEHGLTQEAVNGLIAKIGTDELKARIAAVEANIEAVRSGDALLGSKATERKQAVSNWLKGFGFTPEEHESMRAYATDAHTVTALEKIIAKASGSVPAGGDQVPPKPAEQSLTDRWYGKTTPSQKAS